MSMDEAIDAQVDSSLLDPDLPVARRITARRMLEAALAVAPTLIALPLDCYYKDGVWWCVDCDGEHVEGESGHYALLEERR